MKVRLLLPLVLGVLQAGMVTPFGPDFGLVLPEIVCPPDYVKFHSQCVKSVRETETSDPITTCPFGFTMNGHGMCEASSRSTDIKMPNFECPAGYHLSGHSCLPSNVSPKCPPGYNYDGTTCVQLVPSCPPGYYFKANMCYPETPVRPITIPEPIRQQPCPYAPPAAPCNVQPCLTPPAPCATGPVTVPCGAGPIPCGGGGPGPVPVPIPPITTTIVEPTQFPVAPVPVCPPGYTLNGYSCIAERVNGTIVAPIKNCPPGFYFKNGQCIKQNEVLTIAGNRSCPPGFILHGDWCVLPKDPTPPTLPPPHPRDHLITSPNHSFEKNITIVVNNPINVPVNITNYSNHTINVYPGGASAITIPPPAPCCNEKVIQPVPETEPEEKCCEVVSPRICKRKFNRSWSCYHRKTEQCGARCTSPVIQLRPPRPMYRPMQMVMPAHYLPPPPPPMIYRPNDCSICARGSVCPSYCQSYDCEATDSCSFVDQGEYCSGSGGSACSEEFGYYPY